MLDHILAGAQEFERAHGEQPNIVFINPEHHKALLTLYPTLFERDPRLLLGLRLVIIPSSKLTHPQAAYVAGYSASA